MSSFGPISLSFFRALRISLDDVQTIQLRVLLRALTHGYKVSRYIPVLFQPEEEVR